MVLLKLNRFKVDKIIIKLICIEFLYIFIVRFFIKIYGLELIYGKCFRYVICRFICCILCLYVKY